MSTSLANPKLGSKNATQVPVAPQHSDFCARSFLDLADRSERLHRIDLQRWHGSAKFYKLEEEQMTYWKNAIGGRPAVNSTAHETK